MGYFSKLREKLDQVANEQDEFKRNLESRYNMPPNLLNDSEAMGSMSLSMKPVKSALSLLDLDALKKRGIKPSLEHLSADDAESFGLPWAEKEYNYRLENMPTKKYLVQGKNVVGHVGLNEDDAIRAAYINKDLQGQGLGKKMYELLFKEGNAVKSDDLSAMEPGAKGIWESMKKKMPKQIKSGPGGYEYVPPKTSLKSVAPIVGAAAGAHSYSDLLRAMGDENYDR